MEEYITYQKFFDKEEIDDFAKLLVDNNILYKIENNSLDFDPSFANSNQNNEYRLKLKKSDFVKVDTIQIESLQKLIDGIDSDHYLFSFTDDELIEVVVKSDEWSKIDFLLAQKILKERGKEINESLINALKTQRITNLSKQEESQKSWIVGGYLFALFGGFFGLFIGWHLFTHKKTLPNGDRIYAYVSEDRKHGKIILIIGIIFFIFWMALAMVKKIKYFTFE